MEVGGDVGAWDNGKSSQGKKQRSTGVGQRETPATSEVVLQQRQLGLGGCRKH